MNLFTKFRFLIPLAAFGGLLLLAGPVAGRAQTALPSSEVQKIVRDASWNELHPHGPPHFFRFRLAEEDPKGSDVKLVVQTKDGTIARLIEKNGNPLTPQQNRAELARLNVLAAHPEVQQRRHRNEQENSTREDELVRMLPDAFLYTDEGMVQGPNGPCYRISFKPNPAFVPPDREGEVFHGMVGELWVDQVQQRIVRIDAHLISDVNFGWGVLGKLYQGGSILEENADVGEGHWESTLLRLRLQGKILMVKSVDYSSTDHESGFRPIPEDTTYQQAIEMLTQDKVMPTSGDQ
jgi:hypothetical protein